MPYKCKQGHVTSMLDLCARCFVDDPNYKNLPISTLKGLPIHNDLFGYNDFYAMVDQLGPPPPHGIHQSSTNKFGSGGTHLGHLQSNCGECHFFLQTLVFHNTNHQIIKESCEKYGTYNFGKTKNR